MSHVTCLRSEKYHHIETVSVPRIRKYKKILNPFEGKNLSDVQQIKSRYNMDEQMIKLGLLNIRSLTSKSLIFNDMITDYNLGVQFDRNLAKTR